MLGSHLDSQESVIKNITSFSSINSLSFQKSSKVYCFASSVTTECPGIGILIFIPFASITGNTSFNQKAAHSPFSLFSTLS